MTIENWFFRHVGELATGGTSARVQDGILAAAGEAGFDAVVAGEVDLEHRQRSHFFINTWPKAWLEYYAREKVHEFDPLIARIDEKPQTFAWSDITPANKRERQLFEETRRFGWMDGLAICIPRSTTKSSIVSLTSPNLVPGGEWRRLVALYFTLAYEKFRALKADLRPTNLAGFTTREIECLTLIAKGLTDPEIGHSLGISTATAHEHVERAKKRLACRSRAQLMAVAVAMGAILP